ncbi:serine/threonine protein phosphatase [Amylibacter sp. SFDW26]|nr:serine/threonine protein phosphatase [Amylibacter sp. SFDW26]
MLEPLESIFIIGDIHGCADLLKQILRKRPDGTRLIFVGDLIDRGHQSAEVLSIVKKLCDQGAICLMGNHEKMMLDFLERPTEKGSRWLRHGGLQTLQSYNVRGINERSSDQELLAARDVLRRVLPDGMERWIRDLPLQWSSGNVHVVHAAADPKAPMGQQLAKVLLWGSRQIMACPRLDCQWVVHGHTIVEKANIINGCVAIDTGAYATNLLTGAYISFGKVTFIETGD